VATGERRRHRRSAGAAVYAPSQRRSGHPAAADVRVHRRGSAPAAHADGRQRRGADRLDGHRQRDGRALGSPAPALRLFPADVRPGDQPAAGRDPRAAGDDDVVDGGAGGESARPPAGVVPADQDRIPRDRQRAAGAAAPRLSARVPVDDHPDPVRCVAGRRGSRARGGGPEAARQRRRGCRLHDRHPVRSRRRSRSRADPQPAGDGRGAPPSGPPGHAHAVRAGRRIGGRARGAPLRAAARIRRRGRQPVPGIRDDCRAGSRRPPARRGVRDGGRALHQGVEQRDPQGDVEDGDLDTPELLRRADFRSGRPRRTVRREALHGNLVPHRRRRAAGDRARVAGAPSTRVRAGRARRRGPDRRRRVPVAAGRANAPLHTGNGVQAAARDPHRAVRDFQGVHAAGRRSDAPVCDVARPARAASGHLAGSPRRSRTRGTDRQAVRHRRDVVRLDQRRGAHATGAMRTATGAAAPSSRWPPAGSA
jgi:hypothetical protein